MSFVSLQNDSKLSVLGDSAIRYFFSLTKLSFIDSSIRLFWLEKYTCMQVNSL